MRVCDKHIDRSAAFVFEDKATSAQYDLCKSCQQELMTWLGHKTSEGEGGTLAKKKWVFFKR